MSDFFQNLRKSLFGKRTKTRRVPAAPQAVPESESSPPSDSIVASPRARDPYFVQIGLDFGTAFSKCVCRDINLDKAWVYKPSADTGQELPFLIPNAVGFDGTSFFRFPPGTTGYKPSGLYHVKMALQKIGLRQLNDPVLEAYRQALPDGQSIGVSTFVQLCAIYLLAGTLYDIRADIADRFPGFGSDPMDYTAVNMAVPVADADSPAVNSLFDSVLRLAWVLSEDLNPETPISLPALAASVRHALLHADAPATREACYIYPEVSANVQGFIRSRTSRPGIYIFSDTGAGTVDQSVFIFARPNDEDRLTYLHADVLPLGSSHIERIAAGPSKATCPDTLDHWRRLKETNQDHKNLTKAREKIHADLAIGTKRSIALAKPKLLRREQINDTTIIFGGGGHCENPYHTAASGVFKTDIFHPDKIQDRIRKRDAFEIGMPKPKDLTLHHAHTRWLPRLTVAYGLSFEKGQLARFELPSQVEKPPEELVWQPRVVRAPLITKDDV